MERRTTTIERFWRWTCGGCGATAEAKPHVPPRGWQRWEPGYVCRECSGRRRDETPAADPVFRDSIVWLNAEGRA